jgi:hypothetical protein
VEKSNKAFLQEKRLLSRKILFRGEVAEQSRRDLNGFTGLIKFPGRRTAALVQQTNEVKHILFRKNDDTIIFLMCSVKTAQKQ